MPMVLITYLPYWCRRLMYAGDSQYYFCSSSKHLMYWPVLNSGFASINTINTLKRRVKN